MPVNCSRRSSEILALAQVRGLIFLNVIAITIEAYPVEKYLLIFLCAFSFRSIRSASMIARIGSMVAPFVISMRVLSEVYPPIIFGVIPIIGALLVLLLPETRGYVSNVHSDLLLSCKIQSLYLPLQTRFARNP